MTVREYKIINTLKEVNPKNVKTELLKILSKENPSITLDEAYMKIVEYEKILLAKSDSLIQKFKFDGIEYGIIPDFDSITVAEFLDIQTYERSADNINKLLAVLYRPITSQLGQYYTIEKYNGTGERGRLFEDLDIKIYKSVVNFFLSLSLTLLENDSNTSTARGKTVKDLK